MAKKKRYNGNDQRLAREISLQSLFCLFNTSDPNFIADSLFKRKSELEALTKSNLNSGDLIDLLRMFINVYNLKNSNKRSQLLAITHSEEFVNNIKHFLQCNINSKYLKEAIDLIMYFVDVNINELPISDVCYNRFYSLLKVLNDVLADDNISYHYWTHELCLLLQKKIIHREQTKHSWKDLNIYPCPVDLFEKKDIMPNKINGAYKNTDEYLDTIFKLLKEDYEGSLREGILQMKAELRGARTTEKEILVYNNINIERIETDEKPMNGIIHRIAFSIGDKENQLVNTNKPLKYGSLLLFSQCSQFTTFHLATVVEDVELQNTEGSSYKVLKVSFVDNLSQIKSYWQYTMLESKKLFKPYYEVLHAIQSKSIDNFPMEKYIVYLDTTPCFPKYLSTTTEYKIDCKSIKLFSNTSWPNDLLNLDPSQVEALRAALTHELVLIQGPPGSGKTHLAQKIIDILIDNKGLLSTPILLISSDNYSVDVILEPMVLKERNVIRLGSQTKSSVLKKNLLNNKLKPCGRDIKIKIERIKESLMRKMNENGENIEKLIDSLKKEQTSYRKMRDENFALQILSTKVDVIGGTTAGCARLNHLLEKVQPEVVIVENANDVLEAHVIAALSEGCKHLILIGDHKQLKPYISNRNLENYDLDVSLFERMMRSGMKSCVLKEQHRMRPEIASLLSPTVYQIMKYHPAVRNLPKIRGMERNMFFINHEVAENKKKDEDNSFSNSYEGDLLLGLANYLLLQGYSTNDITILVPYAEQLKYMIRAAKTYPLLKDVEILTIDIYAGRENTIILLSLVRSQSAGIGFLSNNNKIVVALSRAKSGLYIIGNMKTLMSGSDLWVSLNAVLKKKQAIGRSINLECEAHKTIIAVSKTEDFKLSEWGRCGLQCNLPLKCGHVCKLKCHPLLEKHATYICRQPCSRFCEKNLHKCRKKCYEECGQCNELVAAVLPCGHSTKKKCGDHKDQKVICAEPTIVSVLCCLRKVVPCWESNSCFYRKVEGPI
ncbi:NFX1-type zinc finger-containing protein 1 [Halyomorpha halys]|uniref:NFX1-type zinc finger-containing protein 1 n=1 Tax=Halyomorpha halys TaxID=286706 RepID=UPI0006D4ECFE|nr:NFX1-type zinc finger-containing protein 1-like [Halyomorpha halys]XP_014276654.1 NFX1-type zinc finger-containing protein 1-like [Halyomorpha halys]XP_014276734.1 NFX1-type zinc finger-containing protein 1-like [Halyomorpha halys]